MYCCIFLTVFVLIRITWWCIVWLQVVVAVYRNDDRSILFAMTVSQLSRYRLLALRLSDFLLLKCIKDNAHCSHKQCLICHSDSALVVLSCSHDLCRTCADRWVHKRLSCPFCRRLFSNTREVSRTGWELTEWSSDDVEKDVCVLQSQLTELWEACESKNMDESLLLTSYQEMPRRLKLVEEDNLVLVEHST
jgi:hypothetical protein